MVMQNLSIVAQLQATPPVVGMAAGPDTIIIGQQDVNEVAGSTYSLTWTVDDNGQAWGRPTYIVALLIAEKNGGASVAVDSLFSSTAAGAGARADSWPVPEASQPGTERSFYAPDQTFSLQVGVPPDEQDYVYRLYLFTPSIGIWWTDPEVDICPP